MSKLQNGNGTWACMACGTTTDTAWGECPQCALVKIQRQAAEDARQFQEEQRTQARRESRYREEEMERARQESQYYEELAKSRASASPTQETTVKSHINEPRFSHASRVTISSDAKIPYPTSTSPVEVVKVPEFLWYFAGGVCFIMLGLVISPHVWWAFKIFVYALYGWGGLMIFIAFMFSMGDMETSAFRKKAKARNASIK